MSYWLISFSRPAEPTVSLSEIVDHGYRLLPEDLGGRSHRVIIANVTYQGIEEMTPLLHFAGQPKPLALTPEMAQRLTTMTQTSLRTAWIGQEIIIQPQLGDEGPIIAILPRDAVRARAVMAPITRPTADARGWRMALGIVAALIIAAAAYTYVYLPQLQATWIELLNLFQSAQR